VAQGALHASAFCTIGFLVLVSLSLPWTIIVAIGIATYTRFEHSHNLFDLTSMGQDHRYFDVYRGLSLDPLCYNLNRNKESETEEARERGREGVKEVGERASLSLPWTLVVAMGIATYTRL